MKNKTLLLALLLTLTIIITGCTAKKPVNTEKTGGNIEQSETESHQSNAENDTPENNKAPISVVNVVALKGPTAMGLVKLMDDAASDSQSKFAYDFSIEAAADVITPKLIKGDIDMAAVPANLASVLYNNTDGQIVVLNVNTLGVLYIVENGDLVNTAEDLRGKTIYTSGKGSTPEYALNYMLAANRLTVGKDVFIEFKSEHSECVAAITDQANSVAMLPQPFVTTAQIANENIRIALDLTQEWEKASDKMLITGVMVARKAFVTEHPDVVDDFLKKYDESIKFVNSNNEEAANLIEKFGIFKAPVAKKALPYCKICFISGNDMKAKLSEYLTELFNQNPASVGGKLPADDFYYNAQ